ncbi:MAG: hypothetical protein IJ654_03905 [Bacteroidales bacterium]|nr:hypothetical protein [Bacteroidales bacterium]
MKAIFISFNQAYNDEIVELLERHGQRGYTRWNDILGRGSADGEPHYGSHAWPVQNMAILTVVEDDRVDPILADIAETDRASLDLGLRAFVWDITDQY